MSATATGHRWRSGLAEGERACAFCSTAESSPAARTRCTAPVSVRRRTPTEGQQRVLDFIVQHHADHGYPPTLREVCDGLGFASTNAASEHIAALIRKGFLHRAPGKARTLCVVEGT